MLDHPQVRTCWLLVFISILLTSTNPCKQEGLRNFSNRQEGCNLVPNSGADFKLIGLHCGFQHFSGNSNLKVGFFVPSLKDSGARSLWVQAVEAQDSFHYFMRSNDSMQWHENAWNVFKPWPTKDVIDPLQLQPENIAVVAFYKNGSGRSIFLPVNVVADDSKPPIRNYTFRFVNGQNLQWVDLLLINSAGQEIIIHKPELTCKPERYPGCIFSAGGNTFTFNLDVSSLPEGEYRLKLTGHVRDGRQTIDEELFYHHP